MKINKCALLLAMALLFPIWVRGAVSGVSFTILGSMTDTNTGGNPYAPPIFGLDGVLYGMTVYGGTNEQGLIYKVTTSGSFSVLHMFHKADGTYPTGCLLSGEDGCLYGFGGGGGSNNLGSIFKITTNGNFTLLYSFGATTNSSGYALDGSYPYGTLIRGRDGNCYGVTDYGGISNMGTVFQFLTNGTLVTLHSFTGSSNNDGAYPYTESLVEGADGVFYGTTEKGGTNNFGTIFKITSTGELTNMVVFNRTNGSYPYAGLCLGADGCLYGTTVYGGSSGYGTAFRLTTNGTFTTIHEFGVVEALFYPEGQLIQGISNTFYGTTYYGGTSSSGAGALFQMTTNGDVTLAYCFTTNSGNSANPYAGVTRDTAGNLYGTTLYGGSKGYGTVYRWSDPTLPTNNPTVPTAGQRWSNSVFTASGKARDNIGVANVYYSVNGSARAEATTTNRWTNWTGQAVSLIPGTNLFQGYAMDYSGNVSVTTNVYFQYVVTNQLGLRTIGLGTFSPNYSNAWLEIGRNYNLTSTPASGFKFVNWVVSTNWGDGVVFSTTNLRFMMATNLTLQAVFADTSSPTLTITAPTAGQRWSNAVFSIAGKVTDNWAPSNVWYQLNSLGWSNALTANLWTNWFASVNLTPGTNLLQAYGSDISGNLSTTSSVSFDFVVTNQLAVQMTGLGAISPNYSNAWLEIGRNYSITSTPASGFKFVNWVVSTNWGGGVAASTTNLIFMMASNLTLQAVLVDTSRPTLTITAPTAGQKMSNALALVRGTAADNWHVSNVWYRLNSNSWNLATTTNGYTNWYTPTLTLTAGTNSVNAYALDLAGNLSTTGSVSFVSSNTFKLQMSFAATQPLTSTGLNLSVQLSSGLSGQVQVSTNLLDWQSLTNFSGTNTTLNLIDPAATNFGQRFYRAVTQ